MKLLLPIKLGVAVCLHLRADDKPLSCANLAEPNRAVRATGFIAIGALELVNWPSGAGPSAGMG